MSAQTWKSIYKPGESLIISLFRWGFLYSCEYIVIYSLHTYVEHTKWFISRTPRLHYLRLVPYTTSTCLTSEQPIRFRASKYWNVRICAHIPSWARKVWWSVCSRTLLMGDVLIRQLYQLTARSYIHADQFKYFFFFLYQKSRQYTVPRTHMCIYIIKISTAIIADHLTTDVSAAFDIFLDCFLHLQYVLPKH